MTISSHFWFAVNATFQMTCLCSSFVYEVNGYELDVRLIPQSSQIDCPIKARYRERFGSCSCGSYCSWDLCRAIVAPSDCLAGTGSVWKWDVVKNAWVAQVVNGITIYFKVFSIFQIWWITIKLLLRIFLKYFLVAQQKSRIQILIL